MRKGLYAALLAACLALPAGAQDAPIQNTIQSQIDAFLADDFARAFTFASPTIKQMFGTPENFGAMVKQGYPMVYRPSSVEMQELREIAGNLWQRVRVTDQSGAGPSGPAIPPALRPEALRPWAFRRTGP